MSCGRRPSKVLHLSSLSPVYQCSHLFRHHMLTQSVLDLIFDQQVSILTCCSCIGGSNIENLWDRTPNTRPMTTKLLEDIHSHSDSRHKYLSIIQTCWC
jgi:hypothetical protein